VQFRHRVLAFPYGKVILDDRLHPGNKLPNMDGTSLPSMLASSVRRSS